MPAFVHVQVAQWKEMAEQQQVLPKISRPRQACTLASCPDALHMHAC